MRLAVSGHKENRNRGYCKVFDHMASVLLGKGKKETLEADKVCPDPSGARVIRYKLQCFVGAKLSGAVSLVANILPHPSAAPHPGNLDKKKASREPHLLHVSGEQSQKASPDRRSLGPPLPRLQRPPFISHPHNSTHMWTANSCGKSNNPQDDRFTGRILRRGGDLGAGIKLHRGGEQLLAATIRALQETQ